MGYKLSVEILPPSRLENMTDFINLVSSSLKAVRKYEDDFTKLDNTEDKLTFIYVKMILFINNELMIRNDLIL